MLLALGLFVALAPPAAQAGTGAVHFYLGAKFLDEEDWDPVDDQTEIGLEGAFGGSDWPVLIDVYLLGSTDQGDVLVDDGSGGLIPGELELSTTELGVGVNKTWTTGKFHPYVVGGIVFVNADAEIRDDTGTFSEDESAVGAWFGGGGYWRLGSSFNLGATLRFSAADVDVFGGDFSGGGTHLGLTLGWGWPAAR